MKKRHQLLIVLFLGLALFVVRDDVKNVYNKLLSQASPKIQSILLPMGDNVKAKEAVLLQSDKVSNLLKSINTPGALKINDGLVLNTDSVRLTTKDVIEETNKNRLANGNLNPLKENSKLDLSAQMKLNDMFKQQYFEHISPDKIGVSDLGERVGYDYIIIGENLALGNFKDSEALLNAWMNSPGHRANILNESYTEIGVAVGRGKYNGQDTWMAVQHFGLPRNACPSINEIIRGVISLNQKEIESMSTDLSNRRTKIESGVVYDGMTINEQIAKYNELVASYNKLILEVKQKISDYNSSVRAFNECLSAKTK